MIGPIKGEINMAPMITAVELTFSPSEAIKVAKIKTQRLVPLNSTPLRMASTVSCSSSLLRFKSRYSLKNLRRRNFLLFPSSILIRFINYNSAYMPPPHISYLKKRLTNGRLLKGKSFLIINATKTNINKVR